jgi:hypothetical protein
MALLTRRALLAAAPALSAQSPRDLSSFGVAADGKTDDTAAIQKAIDSGFGELRFARGVHRISRPLLIDLDRVGPTSISGGGVATILMTGPGPAFRFVGTHAGSADPNSVKPNVWERQRAPMVDGIEIVGAHRDAIGVQLEGLMQPTLTRVVIRRALHGILFTGRNRNAIVADCHIYENRGVGVLLENLNLHQINVSGSHISYNGGGGIVIRKSEVRNIQIGTSDIEANQDRKGPPAANVLFDAREGSVLEGAITGCTLQHGHEGPESANIRFVGRGPADVNKVGNFVIANNALSDVAVNIHLRHARGVVVSGNTFWKGYSHHMMVEGCSNILVGVNNIDRNPDYKGDDAADDVVFSDCTDSSLNGLHMNRAGLKGPALSLRRCRRMRLANVTILDGGDNCLVVDAGTDLAIEGGNLKPGPR